MRVLWYLSLKPHDKTAAINKRRFIDVATRDGVVSLDAARRAVFFFLFDLCTPPSAFETFPISRPRFSFPEITTRSLEPMRATRYKARRFPRGKMSGDLCFIAIGITGI